MKQCSSLRTQIYNSIETAQGFACQYVHLGHMRSTFERRMKSFKCEISIIQIPHVYVCVLIKYYCIEELKLGTGIYLVSSRRRVRLYWFNEGSWKKVKSSNFYNQFDCRDTGRQLPWDHYSIETIYLVRSELERSDSWLRKSWHGWQPRPLPISISSSSKTKKCIDDHFFIQLKLAIHQNG